MKAQTAPHGREDSQQHELQSECAMRSPVGVRILSSTAALRKLRPNNIDVKAVLLQTGGAARDVHVVPPGESFDRRRVAWLRLAAAYRLASTNSKYLFQPDKASSDLRFVQTSLVPCLFILRNYSVLLASMFKIINDLLLTGEPANTDPIINGFNARFNLNLILHGPVYIRCFCFNIT